jgi:RsiW-degrading membrane proteinase PrsW (M82 family)
MNVWLLVLVVSPMLAIAMAGGWNETVLLCCGIGAAIVAAVLEGAIDRALNGYGVTLGGNARTFLLFVPVEECLKYFAILTALRPLPNSKKLVQASVVCAVGFGATENFFYVTGFSSVLFGTELVAASMLRVFMPFAMHLVNGPILVSGYCVGKFRPVAGIALATLFHGFYDAFVSMPTVAATRIAYAIILVGFIISAFIYKTASSASGDNHEN